MKHKLLFSILGLMCLITGLYMMDIYDSSNIRFLFSTVFGVGCTVFGVNIGHIIEMAVMKADSEDVEKVRIELQDERNIYIKNCAKSKTFNLMGYVYMTVILILYFNNVSYQVILTLIGALIFLYAFYFIGYLHLYSKN